MPSSVPITPPAVAAQAQGQAPATVHAGEAEWVDVLIIGAGLSGIGAACHLRVHCPERSLAIVEARERIGGTWDLFRYPGVRSDSDMYTLGYSFKPWTHPKAIADGPSILAYIRETAREHDVERLVRFGHRATRAAWSSREQCWAVEIDCGAAAPATHLRCGFLYVCAGYYRYDAGYTPAFDGAEQFRGRIVHPQHWPEGLDYTGQRVVIIGSGATAVTLAPEMARAAASLTVLQRSPTWMASGPAQDAIANGLRRWLPARAAYALTRWKNVLFGIWIFRLARARPERLSRELLRRARRDLGPDVDLAHFTPRYRPWEQRLCLVPDADLFHAVRDGRIQMVTDRIGRFTEHGILLESGRELPADLVVTATGLALQFLGGLELSVDGRRVGPADTIGYKGIMLSGVPNLAITFGYTNASWTLKADLTAEYVCRLLNHMRHVGARQCMPVLDDPTVGREPMVDFSSGYFQRSLHEFPAQGSKKPWRLNQNYFKDLIWLRHAPLEDGVLRFGPLAIGDPDARGTRPAS